MSQFDDSERTRLDAPVDARTRLFAILGHPIDHVRAPVVWSTLFKRYGINAVFLPAHVEPEGIDAAIAGFKRLKNIDGLMFTMPHKVAALRHADDITERARRVGSLNLLRPNADGSWSGDNVDGAGFIAGLAADGISIDGVHAHVNGRVALAKTSRGLSPRTPRSDWPASPCLTLTAHALPGLRRALRRHAPSKPAQAR